MLAVFHLLPVPEIIVPKNSAMSQLLTERAHNERLQVTLTASTT